jgi:hypothetical protein
LATFKKHLPPRQDLLPVFGTVLFPVFSWSIIWFFQKMPGWQPFLSIWDILSILAYGLAFALLESLAVLGLVLILAAILPARVLRAHFVPLGSTLVLGLTFWAIVFQLIFDPVINYWSGGEFALWFGMALVFIILTMLLVHRSGQIQGIVTALADRLTVFVYLYVFLGLLGVVVVAVRNIL